MDKIKIMKKYVLAFTIIILNFGNIISASEDNKNEIYNKSKKDSLFYFQHDGSSFNFRYYDTLMGVHANYILHMVLRNMEKRVYIPLQINAGIGSGGYKIGCGINAIGNPAGGQRCESPVFFGIGCKLNYVKSQNDPYYNKRIYNKKEKYIGEDFIGIELTVAFALGIDVGYYKSLKDFNKDVVTFGIGGLY